MTEILRIDKHKPHEKGLNRVVEVLEQDGVIIYPTDSVYTLGASIYSEKAYKKICELKGVREDKARFSIVCSDFSHLSKFAKQISNSQFRLLRQYLPGPFTFILEATKNLGGIPKPNRKTVGFRIPDIALVQKLIDKLGKPLFSASVQMDPEASYATTAEELLHLYGGRLELIIDGGPCGEVPTTIVDLTVNPIAIIRQGAGNIDLYE